MRILLIDDEQRLLDALVAAFHFRWPEPEVATATDAETKILTEHGLGYRLLSA